MSKKLENATERKEFLDEFDTFLFDCDGVLWEGNAVIPGVVEAMKELREKKKRMFFVTNNSTKSRAEFFKKFEKLGFEAKLDEIYSSAFATAAYLKDVRKFPADKKVYIIGMAGIREELANIGIKCCGAEEDSGVCSDEPVEDDPEVGAVVVGLDTQVNYRKYAKAFNYLRKNEGCLFIMTNEDSTFPTHGSLYPGAGAIASPLITALNRRPDAVLGKPAQDMLNTIFTEHSEIDKAKTCMVGDRLDTDIDFGIKGGLATLCVLTGVTTEEQIHTTSTKPKYYIDSFADFKEISHI